MKKIVMVLAAAAVVSSAFAQNELEKKMWVGGAIGLGGTCDKVKGGDFKETSFGFNVNPEIGYRFNEKWGIGIKLGVDYTKYKTTIKDEEVINDRDNTLAFGAELFARWNFVTIANNKLHFFLDMSVGYAHGRDKERVNNVTVATDHFNEFKVGLRPGIMFDLSPSVSLIAKFGALGYQNTHICGGGDSSKWGFDFSGGNLQFGCLFNF